MSSITSLKLTFDAPSGTKIIKPGHDLLVYGAEDFKNLEAMIGGGEHPVGTPTGLFDRSMTILPDLNLMMLRLDYTLRNTSLFLPIATSWTEEHSVWLWETREITLSGQDDVSVLHHFPELNVSGNSEQFTVRKYYPLHENQGFMLTFRSFELKGRTEEYFSRVIIYKDGYEATPYFAICLSKTGNSWVEFFHEDIQKKRHEFSLPEEMKSGEPKWYTMIVMFIDRQIVISLSKVDEERPVDLLYNSWYSGYNSRVFVPSDYFGIAGVAGKGHHGTYSNFDEEPIEGEPGTWELAGKKYPVIVPNGAKIKIEGFGGYAFTFTTLYYHTPGYLTSGWIHPLYEPDPEDWSLRIRAHMPDPIDEFSIGASPGNGEPLIEDGGDSTYKYKLFIHMSGVNYDDNIAVDNLCHVIPLLYGVEVRAEPEVGDMNPDYEEWAIETDVIRYREKKSIDSHGTPVPAFSELQIEGYGDIHEEITAKNLSMSIELGTKDGKTKRATHLTDEVIIVRPGFNQYRLNVTSKDIFKRCQNNVLLSSEIMDGMTHRGAMARLANLARVQIQMDDDSDPIAPPLPGDIMAPQWKFTRGTQIWQCMLAVRNYSRWMLYADKDGKVQYRRRPKLGDQETAYTFSDKPEEGQKNIENIIYYEADTLRTRIIVLGRSNEFRDSENTPETLNWDYSGETYNMGDIIAAVFYDLELEKEINESRPGVFIEPNLGNYAACAWMCNNLAKWYAQIRTIVQFKVPYAEDILDLEIFNKIRIIDDKRGWDEYYQVMSLEVVADPTLITMKIGAMNY